MTTKIPSTTLTNSQYNIKGIQRIKHFFLYSNFFFHSFVVSYFFFHFFSGINTKIATKIVLAKKSLALTLFLQLQLHFYCNFDFIFLCFFLLLFFCAFKLINAPSNNTDEENEPSHRINVFAHISMA